MSKLILTRHGQSIWNAENRFTGWVDVDLSEKGKEEAKGITSLAERESETILAEAYRESQEIKGQGDAQSTQIYADAFSASPDFYSFYRSLEAYKSTFNDKGNMILLKPDSDFFKFFNDTDGVTK